MMRKGFRVIELKKLASELGTSATGNLTLKQKLALPYLCRWPAILFLDSPWAVLSLGMTKIEMRIINVDFPRFVIIDGRKRYWTGKGWNRRLGRALLYAHADFLRQDIEMLKKNCG